MDNIIVVALKAMILFQGKVLVIQRSADDETGANTWEFAGGKLDFGESLEEALKREVKEETDLEIDISRLLYAATFRTNGHRQVVILTYLCSARNGDVKLSPEHQSFMWADKQQMLERLAPPITDDLEANKVWEQLKLTNPV